MVRHEDVETRHMNGVYVFYTEFRQLLESVWTVWWCKFRSRWVQVLPCLLEYMNREWLIQEIGFVLIIFKLYHLGCGSICLVAIR